MGPLESFFWTNPKIQIGQISDSIDSIQGANPTQLIYEQKLENNTLNEIDVEVQLLGGTGDL